MNKFKSLKTKLIVCTIVIVCLTAILNLIVGIVASNKSITQNVESDLRSIGQTTEVAISSSLSNIKLGVQSTAKSDMIGKADVTQADLLVMYLRRHLIELINKLKKKGITVILLSVNIADSLVVADKLILLEKGRFSNEYLSSEFNVFSSEGIII